MKASQLNKVDATAEKILRAAIKLFAQKGYDGTSTKEICEEAGVNIAAVHYHFESKENLYAHILKLFGKDRIDSLAQTLEPAASVEEFRVRLQLFLRMMLESIVAAPELPRILHRELDMPASKNRDMVRGSFAEINQILADFIAHGKKQGFVAKKIDEKLASHLFFSQIAQWSRLDARLQKEFGMPLSEPAFRIKLVDNALNIFLNGVLEKSS